MVSTDRLELAVVSRLCRYRFFDGDLSASPRALYNTLTCFLGARRTELTCGHWPRQLHAFFGTTALCFGCKRMTAITGVSLTPYCIYCKHHFDDMLPVHQELHLKYTADMLLMLSSFSSSKQAQLLHVITRNYLLAESRGDTYSGILPQSYRHIIQKEDGKSESTITQLSQDIAHMSKEI